MSEPIVFTVRYNREHRLVIGNLGWLPPETSGQAWAA